MLRLPEKKKKKKSSPVRREEQEGHRHREKEHDRRREREEWRNMEGHESWRRTEGRIEEEERREGRSREERRREDAASFLDLGQLIRQEVQRAFLSLLPAGASGSAPSQARPTTMTPPPSINWAELIARSTSN